MSQTLATPPTPQQPISGPNGLVTISWYRWLSALLTPTNLPTLTGVGTLTSGAIGAGFTGINATPIGSVTPAAGKFTTLGATAINDTPIGTGVAAPGAFTLLSASTSISGAGFTAWAASPPAIGGTTPAAGKFTTLAASGLFTPTGGIVGVTDGSNATAGNVGEYISASNTGVSLTTATPANITSISLTAGDWDVQGVVAFAPAATTTISTVEGGINTTSATFPAIADLLPASLLQGTLTTGANQQLALSAGRISVNTTTTVYLVAEADFGISTMTGSGWIAARRVR